mmetsp:Transcript_4681/g.9435  ORF Transcript_4681/g.9435 Transcript_4681/m.9435 type:complete len:91 (-) Transcript_4681:884-1156(-)
MTEIFDKERRFTFALLILFWGCRGARLCLVSFSRVEEAIATLGSTASESAFKSASLGREWHSFPDPFVVVVEAVAVHHGTSPLRQAHCAM